MFSLPISCVYNEMWQFSLKTEAWGDKGEFFPMCGNKTVDPSKNTGSGIENVSG